MDDLILGLPVLYWIIGAVVLVAVIALIVIICCAVHIRKTKTAAAESKVVKTEEPVAEATSVEEAEVAEEKPAEKEQPAEKKTTAKTTADKPATKTTTKTTASAKTEPAKPTTKTYHVSKRKDENMWQVKAAGGAKAIKLFKTQKEAIDFCKTLADNQDANIMIHKEDGSFRKLTY
ncbi:MAG: DUF2188 domain-containing protein [Clostridia bacterium]|nr:DUF2188 domain-containing protein [Clostridia bacterium]